MDKPVKLAEKEIKTIEATLAKGERVEIVRTADGVKFYTVKRKELNNKT